ncbi:TetR/AcrR family transcriptional regulator [Haliangium ochraceum]|uniref:Transcriptional regulator, TetR family n=1 Tax=Haliangium ochraceum (strain DSM 14365 / JCM 11303 / SMP-2) TaxID=502025 RepID=D0LR09_HALO1|nr:TetR/AcrR family transcriptional regulator [Haliangium ochraceum]ACY15517.1 transcriptional regulator, TetR family [Haliangium ochraceum DSM 14365]
MARVTLSADEVAAFRERAVAAAMRLFVESGYEGVSMRAVAAELGVSPMTPYRYVRNKDELFTLVRIAAFRRLADRQRATAQAHPPGAQRLRALGAAYLAFASDEPQVYRIMFELEQSASAEHPELEAEQRRAMSYLLEAVTDAIAAGDVRGDPLTYAHLLWAQVHGLVSLHLAGKLILGRSFEQLRASPFFAGDDS